MKMYILVRDTIPTGFAILAAAHASLACYLRFRDSAEVASWLAGPFYKVVCRVTDSEFESAKMFDDYVLLEPALGSVVWKSQLRFGHATIGPRRSSSIDSISRPNVQNPSLRQRCHDPTLFSVSYAGYWGQHRLTIPQFFRKAAELGYRAVEVGEAAAPFRSRLQFGCRGAKRSAARPRTQASKSPPSPPIPTSPRAERPRMCL